MPAIYRIDHQLRIVITTLEGVVTDDDLLNHQQQLRTDPDFELGFNQLADCRLVTEVKVTSQGIRVVAAANLYPQGTRRAIVAETDVIYGMARMFQLMRDGEEEVAVFRQMGEARRWLGIEMSDEA